MAHMKKELAEVKAKCEDSEARSRRCNVRITGIKEGRENGQQPSWFVAGMLKETLGLKKTPCLDRVHVHFESDHKTICHRELLW